MKVDFPQSRPISAIILAAGQSTRMELFKPLVPIGRRTPIDICVNLFKTNGIEDIVVVTGHKSGDLMPRLNALKVRGVYNPDYRQGMFSSIITGLKNIAPISQGFFILPVDIPLVQPETIHAQLRRFNSRPNRIVHPCYKGRRGYPPLVPIILKSQILVWQESQGFKGCMAAYDQSALNVDVPDPYILMDMDTKEAYQKILNAYKLRHSPGIC